MTPPPFVKNRFISQLRGINPHFAAMIALTLVWLAVTAAFALTRFYTYKTSIYDIGVFDQLLWSFIHTGIPTATIHAPYEPYNWLGVHFSPLILLLAPFYALFPYPDMLVVLQPIFIASAVLPLWYIGRHVGLSDIATLGWVTAYLINPFTFGAAMWEFHEISLAAPIMGWGMWALITHRYAWLVLFCFLLVMIKEHYGITVAGFGVAWAVFHQDWKRGVLLTIAGGVVFLVIVGVVIPYFSPLGSHIMLQEGNISLSRYDWISSSEDKFVTYLYALITDGIIYMGVLSITTLFMHLQVPILLLPAAADLLANILSAVPMPRTVFAYHSAVLAVIFIAAGIVGLSRVAPDHGSGIKFRPMALFFAAMLLCLLATTNLLWIKKLWRMDTPMLTKDSTIADIKAMHPTEIPASVQLNIGGFFSQRYAIFPFPAKLDSVQTVILHLDYPFPSFDIEPAGIPYGVSSETYLTAVRTLLNNKEWGVVLWQAPWLVMHRGAADKIPSRAVIGEWFERMIREKSVSHTGFNGKYPPSPLPPAPPAASIPATSH